MATTTEEIAIKLGIKNADLKAALADSGAAIKSFKEKGESGAVSVGNVFGKLADKVGGLRDVTSSLAVALGLNLEKIAESVARAITGFSQAEEEATKKFVELQTANTEESIRQIRKRGTEEQQYQAALANRAALQKKIVEFNVMESVIVAGIADEYGRDILPPQKELVVSVQKQLELEQLKSEQLKINATIVDYEAKKAEERKQKTEESSRNEYANSVKQRDAARELMTLEERRNSLLSEESALQTVIAIEDKNSKEYAADENRLLDVQKQIRSTNLEIAKGLSLGEKEDLELFRLKVKAKQAETDETKTLTIAEKARLLTLTLQLEAQKRALEVNQLYAKLLNGTITQAEQDRLKRLLDLNRLQELYGKLLDGTITPSERSELAVLIQQTDEVGKQLRKKLDIIAATTKQADAIDDVSNGEQGVTDELRKQIPLISKAADEEERRARAVLQAKMLAGGGGNIKTTGASASQLNDVQLDQLIQNLNKQLGPIKSADSMVGGVGGFLGTYKSIEQRLLQNTLDQAIAEKNLRSDFIQTITAFGDEGAQRAFSPSDYDRLKNLFNPDLAKKQGTDISSIAQTLKNLFPDQWAGLT